MIVVVIAVEITTDRDSMLFRRNSPEVSSGMIRPGQVYRIGFQHERHNRDNEKRMKEKKRTRAISIQA